MTNNPMIIAHRGASGSAPENTPASFGKALALGADMIELDVHLTKDNELVVIHDHTLDRTTDGTGRVCDHCLADIKKLDAGSWYHESFAGERIPTLSEVFHLLDGRMPVNVEVKVVQEDNRQALCAALAEKLLKVLDDARAEELVLISSFDWDLLEIIGRLRPSLPLAYLFSSRPASLRERMGSGVLKAIHPSGSCIDADMIKEAHEFGLKVNIWTINSKDDMVRLAGMGVDGLITNYPERWDR